MIDQQLRSMVPEHTIGSIDRYIDQRIEPGGFLRAVLENNLKEAMAVRTPLTGRRYSI